MNISKLYNEFFQSEKSGGLLLILATLFSLIMANTGWKLEYNQIWHTVLAGHTLTQWINDGLMTLFFLLIGLELEREIYQGELARVKDALLPIIGALGGVLIPILIYTIFNYNSTTRSGAGIPMATDIAFALAVLSLLGKRVPTSMKIFLTALAVIDDLAAIIVISLFYSSAINLTSLMITLGIFLVLLILNKLKVKSLISYLIGGFGMWYFMLHSGIHPSITGVLLAFAIPFGKGDNSSPSYKLQHLLNKPVAFLVLPLFAIANTDITLNSSIFEIFSHSYTLGILFGLVIGKPIGIFLFVYSSVKLKITKLPKDLNWSSIWSVALLGGIGFTMSIFISMIAFENVQIISNSILAILFSSFIAGIIGYFTLKYTLNAKTKVK